MLGVEGLSYSYGRREVLREVAFSLEGGDILFIIGPNGSGKTTLLKCLNGILKGRGTVYVEGMRLSGLSQPEIAKLFGYVPQRGEVSFLTVFDVVLLGRKPHMTWGASERDLSIVEEVMRMLGIEDLALRRLNELSGGELQLVLIARALAQEPKVLLLDEPTSNLDIRNQMEVMRVMRRIARERGVSVVIAEHDINLALSYGNKFLVLKSGHVFAFGGQEVISGEMLREVYGIDAEVLRFDGRVLVIPQT